MTPHHSELYELSWTGYHGNATIIHMRGKPGLLGPLSIDDQHHGDASIRHARKAITLTSRFLLM